MGLGNSRQAWQSIKAMTSAPHKGNRALKGGEGQDTANYRNVFFSRFEKGIGTNTDQKQPDLTTSQSINISQTEVCAMFKSVNTRKSPSPDNICGNVLKFCAEQLSPVFRYFLVLSGSVHCSTFMENINYHPHPQDSFTD